MSPDDLEKFQERNKNLIEQIECLRCQEKAYQDIMGLCPLRHRAQDNGLQALLFGLCSDARQWQPIQISGSAFGQDSAQEVTRLKVACI